jgi:hypothetical protein
MGALVMTMGALVMTMGALAMTMGALAMTMGALAMTMGALVMTVPPCFLANPQVLSNDWLRIVTFLRFHHPLSAVRLVLSHTDHCVGDFLAYHSRLDVGRHLSFWSALVGPLLLYAAL